MVNILALVDNYIRTYMFAKYLDPSMVLSVTLLRSDLAIEVINIDL